MRMRSAARLLIGALFLTLLASCGGGNSPVFNSAWNLKSAYLGLSPNQNSTPVTYLFNVTGAVGSDQISGTGSMVVAPHISGTFESSTASQQVAVLEADYTVIGGAPSVIVLSSTLSSWYSLNNGPFGETHQACSTGCSNGLLPVEYIVYGTSSSNINLPTSASSGATGTLYTGQRYSNATKATPLGTVVATYSVTAANGGAAYFDITIIEKDTNANQVSRRVMHYYLDPSDAISLKGLSLTDSTKDINFVVR